MIAGHTLLNLRVYYFSILFGIHVRHCTTLNIFCHLGIIKCFVHDSSRTLKVSKYMHFPLPVCIRSVFSSGTCLSLVLLLVFYRWSHSVGISIWWCHVHATNGLLTVNETVLHSSVKYSTALFLVLKLFWTCKRNPFPAWLSVSAIIIKLSIPAVHGPTKTHASPAYSWECHPCRISLNLFLWSCRDIYLLFSLCAYASPPIYPGTMNEYLVYVIGLARGNLMPFSNTRSCL